MELGVKTKSFGSEKNNDRQAKPAYFFKKPSFQLKKHNIFSKMTYKCCISPKRVLQDFVQKGLKRV